jgi:hypothetical protein
MTDQRNSEVGMPNPAEAIIAKFGGLSSLARIYVFPDGSPRPVTTVQSWKDRGRIPQDHWRGLIEAARRHDLDLQIDEFLPRDAEAAA